MLMLSVAGLTVLTSHGNRGHLTPPLPMGVALTLGQPDIVVPKLLRNCCAHSSGE